jgi:hypothetical protein
MVVELGVLGEVTARVDGARVDLGPARQRCVLAVLAVDESTVDLHRFRVLLARARAAEDDEQAAARYEEAFALWRGEPFAGLDSPWLAGVRDALAAEHLATRLDHDDVQLRRDVDAAHAGSSPLIPYVRGNSVLSTAVLTRSEVCDVLLARVSAAATNIAIRKLSPACAM